MVLKVIIVRVVSMKLLKWLGMGFFFVHYYIVLALVLLKNAACFLWNAAKQTPEKVHISPFAATHPLVFAPVHHIVSHDGFTLEQHRFPTVDGADVALWRVRREGGGKGEGEGEKALPILLMHGLLDCSVSWFLHVDKSRSLPYILAGQGWDVWVGNNRGNRLSRDEDDACPRYWEYTFDHLVDHDQPAVIEGVLTATGKQKVVYIGHSQGSTQFMLGLGVHPHLKERIACFIGLGSVVSLQNVNNHTVLQCLSRLRLLQFYRLLGFRKILVLPKVISRAVGVLLYNSGFHSEVMQGFIRLLCGFSDRNKIPQELFGVIITHEPGGSSVNNALHWVQCYRHGGVMRRFDYGKKENLLKYGCELPPVYGVDHLGELPFTTHLFRGTKDAVMNEKDFSHLVAQFHPQRIHTYEVVDYNHLDYVWSETAHHDLYGHIADIAAKIVKSDHQ